MSSSPTKEERNAPLAAEDVDCRTPTDHPQPSAPKRPRRVSLELFFQPIPKKRSKPPQSDTQLVDGHNPLANRSIAQHGQVVQLDPDETAEHIGKVNETTHVGKETTHVGKENTMDVGKETTHVGKETTHLVRKEETTLTHVGKEETTHGGKETTTVPDDDDDIMIVDEHPANVTPVHNKRTIASSDKKSVTPSQMSDESDSRSESSSNKGRAELEQEGMGGEQGADEGTRTTAADKRPGSSSRRRLTSAEKQQRLRLKQLKQEEREQKQREREKQKELEQEEKQRRMEDREMQRKNRQLEREREMEKKRIEKEMKEEARQEIERLKMEEKQKKDEERRKKEEYRRRVEERRKKEEEDKKRKEEAEMEKARKHAERFRSFFEQKKRKGDHPTMGAESSRFRPFQLKEGMRVAPLLRCPPLEGHHRLLFDNALSDQKLDREKLYVMELKKGHTVRQCKRTFEAPDLQILSDDDGSTQRMKVKYLHFHTSSRPPYYGTWRKRSALITGRRPLRQDTIFDYDVNSDEEWEADEEGDDCCDSDDDLDPDPTPEDEDEENDGFFVEHGYLSDDEGVSDAEADQCADPETRRDRMMAKAEAWKSSVRLEKERKKNKLVPFVIGPCWDYDKLDLILANKLKLFKGVLVCQGPVSTSYNRSAIVVST